MNAAPYDPFPPQIPRRNSIAERDFVMSWKPLNNRGQCSSLPHADGYH
jgi:hypothetical protein